MHRSRKLALIAIVLVAVLISVTLVYPYFRPRGDTHELIPTYDTERFAFPEIGVHSEEHDGILPGSGIYLENESYLESLQMAGDYLSLHTRSTGKYHYEYDPVEDIVPSTYNIVRHAGTAYSMAVVFKYTRDLEHYNATVLAINWMIHETMEYEKVGERELAYIKYKHEDAKVGTSALGVMALIELSEVDPEVDYEREIDALGELLFRMVKDNGQMQCYYKTREDDHNDYYPGESMLALARLYRYTGEQRYLEGLEKSLDFYVDYYGEGEYTSFTPWGTEAMLYAYDELEKPEYLDLCHRMARACLRGQNNDWEDIDPLHVGGWGSDPRSSSASRVEGPVDTYLLAKRIGNDTMVSELEEGIIKAGKFLMNLQYDHDDAQEFPDPESTVGGIPFSHSEKTIRIDNVQHSVVVLAKLMVYRSSDNYF